jgi:competence protein ComGC
MKQQMIPSGVTLYEMDRNRKKQTICLLSETVVNSQKQVCEQGALGSQEANPSVPVQRKQVDAETVF